MKLLNRPLDVESAKLTAPPKGGTRLATDGRLLVVWSLLPYVSDLESGEEYHLAFYHPEFGWRACRWDVKHGTPNGIFPISESTIWVSTTRGKIIYISGRDEVRATILAYEAESGFSILYADSESLWIRERASTKIMQLYLRKGGFTSVNAKSVSFYVKSMYPLADRAWVLVGDRRICLLQSMSLNEENCEDEGDFFFYPPFLMRKDKDYSYTEDPRHGWKKIPISIENEKAYIGLLAKHYAVYYSVVYSYLVNKTMLYRSSDNSETDAECMWEISGRLYPEQFAMYNGLVCIADDEPLIVSLREDVSKNHGFLIWDPWSNTFYKDIPQFSGMHARHIIPRKLQIPTAWLEDKGRHI